MDVEVNPATSHDPLSPAKPAEETEDVLVTGTSYTEPGNPTVLAKHTTKEEVVQKGKVKFELSNYSQLGVSELLSGYLSQVHAGCELEMGIVKQMHQKYEVQIIYFLC